MQINKKSNTIKNKRKSKSRTRCISSRKNLKGGIALGGVLKKMYLCNANPTAQCVITSLDKLDQVADMPSSLTSLTSYVEIAKKLLKFYKRIDTDAISSQYSQYSNLISTFNRGIKELDDLIRFLETNNIIGELNNAPSKNLIGFITVIVQQIRNSSLSDVTNAGKIAIWANWYRSKLENMVSQLTTTLTQINSIYINLPMNTSHVSPLPDTPPSSPKAANSMGDKVKRS